MDASPTTLLYDLFRRMPKCGGTGLSQQALSGDDFNLHRRSAYLSPQDAAVLPDGILRALASFFDGKDLDILTGALDDVDSKRVVKMYDKSGTSSLFLVESTGPGQRRGARAIGRKQCYVVMVECPGHCTCQDYKETVLGIDTSSPDEDVQTGIVHMPWRTGPTAAQPSDGAGGAEKPAIYNEDEPAPEVPRFRRAFCRHLLAACIAESVGNEWKDSKGKVTGADRYKVEYAPNEKTWYNYLLGQK